ncbi:MAG: helix-turn-helix transcriptional regulator [Erysipelothrix sp.]|nr:helix-turn-helix transcriptional regulator [Erysipelothrix sp.]
MENKIRHYRELKKISQETISKKVGVSRQTIISMEKGSYNPSLYLAMKLSKVLEVTIEELFQLEEDDETN